MNPKLQSSIDAKLVLEAALQRSDLDFYTLLERLPAAAYTCDREGLITYFNRHAVQLWGREPKLNDPVDRFCGSFKLFDMDGTPLRHDQCWMALALQTGVGYDGQEIIIERPDGNRINALAHANPIRNEAGEIVGAVNVLVDVSAQKRGEEAQARLAAIVESSDDAIVSKTLEGIILTWNRGAERLFGYSAKEVIGRSITMIIPPELHDEEKTILSRLRRGERIDHYETVRMAKDGRRIDISLTVSPLRDASGRVVGASKVARDITARKQAEAERREAERRKDEFLATLAHELRNPLAPISNALHLMRLSDDLSPAVDQLRQIMERQVAHLVRLVDDLLEVSRLSRGTVELRRELVELSAIIATAVETSRPRIEAAGHQLAISLPPQPIVLHADTVRLCQAIANLLNNAARYMDPGGQIWLTAQVVMGEVVISVRDTGLGIAPEMLTRIFDMFTQGDSAGGNTRGGLGIGLTLARRLIEMHGGTLEACSEGLGRGSQFVVRLPVMADAPSVPSPPSRAAHQPLPARRRILIVDDTQATVYVLGKLLENMGQTVDTAKGGPAALEYVKTHRPDLVISDIAMPDMSGYELARRLRQDANLKDVVLVALTGYGQDRDRRMAKEAGFDIHLTKPVSVEALRELLASVPSAKPASAEPAAR